MVQQQHFQPSPTKVVGLQWNIHMFVVSAGKVERDEEVEDPI
jgi:hypothetical protein